MLIVGSFLLILVAVVTFGLGLARGSNVFLVASIGASLHAAIAVVLGARQAAAARATLSKDSYDGLGDPEPTEAPAELSAGRPRDAGRRRAEGTVYGREAEPAAEAGTGLLVEDEPAIPSQATGSRHVELDFEADLGPDPDDDDPPDEPAAQLVTPADAARVARLSAEVLVIDGRPRYHQPGCVHLLGRESEPLPVSEAIELGFTPCSLCEPDSALLAEARRV